MQVKTFVGSGTQEVLTQVKAEMGADAVILGSREIRRDGQRLFEITAGVDRSDAAPSAAAPPGWDEWHQEWSRIKDHLYTLMQPALPWEKLSPRQRVTLEYLRREGVEGDVVVELYKALTESPPGSSMLGSLAALVPVSGFSRHNWPQRLHLLTGPFGAGKTATALRLGMSLRQRHPDLGIAYLNADCARGNGRLVLRHWTELSDFAYYETPDAADMLAALRACQKYDVVFVDLPGLAKGESLPGKLAALGLAGQSSADMAAHLVLPPLYSGQQTASILRRHACPHPSSLIWTKLDEAVNFGQLVNVAVRSKLPVSALSYGPELKASLAPAEEGLIWRLLLKRQLPGSAETGKAA